VVPDLELRVRNTPEESRKVKVSKSRSESRSLIEKGPKVIDLVLVESVEVPKWARAIDLRRTRGRDLPFWRKSLRKKKECVEQELPKAGESEFI
jgi:hypothetical protein